MNPLSFSKIGMGLGAAVVALVGCTGGADVDKQNVGSARIHLEAARTSAGEVTRVTIEALGGITSDLERNADGDFLGTLLLPAGSNVLVGRAFVGDTLVGESGPVGVEIQAGFVTAVDIRILDLTGGDDVDHRPIVISLTHPLSSLANTPVNVAVSAVDPDGDALSINWSDNCDDADFVDATAAQTQWSKASAGTCRLDVTVAALDLLDSESFNIVVFDDAQATGAVDVGGVFVSAPRINLNLDFFERQEFCGVFPETSDGTCDNEIASPEAARVSAFVDWGAAEPGTIDIADNCGGAFVRFFQDAFFTDGEWRPPVQESVCLITATAISGEGLVSELSAALLVREGVERPPVQPVVFFDFGYSNGFCNAPNPEEGDIVCEGGPITAGEIGFVAVNVDWRQPATGTIEFFDNCGGEFLGVSSDPFFASAEWQAPAGVSECSIIAQIVTAEGLVVERVATFPVTDAPAADIQVGMSLSHGIGACDLFPGNQSVSCDLPVSLGDRPRLFASVDWNVLVPGTIDIFDTCGGNFEIFNLDSFILDAEWQAVPEPTDCTISLTATSGDGQVSQVFDMFVSIR